MNYIAVIHKDPDSDFGVSFPDFLGCITAGSTIDEAKDLAKEALEGHIEAMLADGDPIPEPSSLTEVLADPDYADGVLFLVPVDNVPEKTVRVNITVPENALRVIDRKAKAEGLARSAYLVKAGLQGERI